MSSSWKLDSSHTIQASSATAPSRPVSGRPTFPATATGRPAARKISPRSSHVVVLPFVPVTPSSGLRQEARAELDLAPDGHAASPRGGHEGYLARDTGALDQQVHVVDERGVLRAQDDFDAVLAKPPGVQLGVPVHADDPHPAARERERRGLARAGQAEDEGPLRKQTRTRSGSRGRTRTRRGSR